MKCNNCGFTLDDNTLICPFCGVDNSQTNEVIDEQIESLNLDTPPEFGLANEVTDLQSSQDINNVSEISNYENEEEIEKLDVGNYEKIEDINISIPSIQDLSEEEIKDAETKANINTDVDNVNVKKKKSFTKIEKGQLIKIGMYTIIFVTGLLIGKSVFSKNYCYQTAINNSTITSDAKYVSDGSNNTININDYTYLIPKSYLYNRESSGLTIYGDSDQYKIFIKSINGNYNNISGSKISIKETLKNNGLSIGNIKEMKINEKSYVTIEATDNMDIHLIALTEGTNNDLFYIDIIDINNSYNYELINIVDDIIKNAKYEKSASIMEEKNNINKSSLIIKTSEEYKKLLEN